MKRKQRRHQSRAWRAAGNGGSRIITETFDAPTAGEDEASSTNVTCGDEAGAGTGARVGVEGASPARAGPSAATVSTSVDGPTATAGESPTVPDRPAASSTDPGTRAGD